MPTSLIVVDDFLDDPYPLRNAALNLTYPAASENFPGRNSTERLNLEGLHQEVSRLVGEPLLPMDHNQAHGKCRISLAADVGNAKVPRSTTPPRPSPARGASRPLSSGVRVFGLRPTSRSPAS